MLMTVFKSADNKYSLQAYYMNFRFFIPRCEKAETVKTEINIRLIYINDYY